MANPNYNTIWGIVLISFILSITGILYIKPAITGYFFFGEEFITLTKSTNWSSTEGGEIIFIPESGELTSLKISGIVIGNGSFRIYLKSSNSSYLILDDSALSERGISGVTGLAIAGETNETTTTENGTNQTQTGENQTSNATEKIIKIRLEYKNGSIYDIDNDGIESIESAIDYTVENTEFNWNANSSNLCTRWQVYSIENGSAATLCYGFAKCCNFINLAPSSDNWNDVLYSYYGKYGAGLNNNVSAQVLYVDYSLEPENIYSYIYFSNWSILKAQFYEANLTKKYFENLCIETCSLPYLNESYYTISFEGENVIIIDTITYTVRRINITNNAPTCNIHGQRAVLNNNITLNLSDYCFDLDNDTISYSVLSNLPFTLNNEILTLNANSTGNKTVTIFASDTIATTSFVFNLTTIPSETISLIQLEPTRWLKTISLATMGNTIAELPEAFNISIKADSIPIASENIKVNYRNRNISLKNYEIEKQLEQIEEQLKKLNNTKIEEFDKNLILFLEENATRYEIEYSIKLPEEAEAEHSEIEIYKPVKWTKKISGVEIELPEEAFNVTFR